MKNNFSLNYVIKMIQHILTVIDNIKDRQNFFNSIMDMFKELILDIHEFGKILLLFHELQVSIYEIFFFSHDVFFSLFQQGTRNFFFLNSEHTVFNQNI